MYHFIFIAGIGCVVAWLYLLAGQGRFWMVRRLAVDEKSPHSTPPTAVVIPARNEADVIGRAIGSLLRQSCAESLHIFVVDDNSSDATAAVAQDAAMGLRPDALTVVTGRPLPGGWTGKLWAMQQGTERALLLQPTFLLFTDADIEHSPESISTLAGMAEREGYDLASFMVKLHCESVAEKLLIPAFVFFFFMLYPPQWVCDVRRKTAAAAGGCILIRPEALQRAGGIGAIRDQIIDDCGLARAVKSSGGRVWLGVTSGTRSLRAYKSFAEIERMVARTAFNQLHHSWWLLAATVLGMAFAYFLPVALLFAGSRALAIMGAAAWLLMLVVYLPTVRFYRLNWLWAFTLPLSAVFYLAATIHSAMKYYSGRGGEWKGRVQDAAQPR